MNRTKIKIPTTFLFENVLVEINFFRVFKLIRFNILFDPAN